MTAVGHLMMIHASTQEPVRVQSVDSRGTAELSYLWSGALLRVSLSEVEIQPYPLVPGMDVVDEATLARGRIEAVRPNGQGLRTALIEGPDGSMEIDESRVLPVDPRDKGARSCMRALHLRRASEFLARRQMREEQSRLLEATDGFPALLGARIQYLPHQLHTMRRILEDRTPRFVIADEVGVGKTIEAGLVIQSLLAADPDAAVLVLAPGNMALQWLQEIYLKFGSRAFTLVGAEGLRSAADDVRMLKSARRLVVSSGFLQQNPEAMEALIGRQWNLVVVDEAHHFPPSHDFYAVLRLLSVTSEGFLALSATPSQRQMGGLLGLLSLVAPDAYEPTDPETLERRFSERRDVWSSLGYALDMIEGSKETGEVLTTEHLESIAEEWEELLPDDAVVQTATSRMKSGEEAALHELVAYVQEFYRVDHRLIRTRRRTVVDLGRPWAQRLSERVEYEASPYERLLCDHLETLTRQADLDDDQKAWLAVLLQSVSLPPVLLDKRLEKRQALLSHGDEVVGGTGLLERLLADPGPAEFEDLVTEAAAVAAPLPGELDWLAAARALAADWKRRERVPARWAQAADWIARHLEMDDGNKVLVFAHEAPVVAGFAAYLRDRRRIDAGAYHWLNEKREEAALRFQKQGHSRVLVSDELGGEGRNFQMASAVLHLDMPWSVMRIEQRIGRLDRMNRDPDRPVLSAFLVGPSAVEGWLAEAHDGIFGVHRGSVGGLEFALPRLSRMLVEGVLSGQGDRTEALSALHAEVQAERSEADQDFDIAHDLSGAELERASEFARQLESVDGGWDGPLERWARALNLRANYKNTPDRGSFYRIKLDPEMLEVQLPGLPAHAQRYEGTFKREKALEDESQHLFAPGHAVVDSLLNLLDQVPNGRVAAYGHELGPQHRQKLYLVALLKADVDARQWADAQVGAGLIHKLRRRLSPAYPAKVFELDPEGRGAPTLVEDVELLARLLSTKAANIKNIPVPVFSRLAEHDLIQTTEAALELAEQEVREERQAVVKEAQSLLKADLGPELGYLRRFAKKDRKTKAEVKAREVLIASAAEQRIEVDALAWVVGF